MSRMRTRTAAPLKTPRRNPPARAEDTLEVGLGEPVLLDARIELGAREPEQFRGARLVMTRLGQRLDHERSLERFEIDAARGKGAAAGRVFDRGGGRPVRRHGQMLA